MREIRFRGKRVDNGEWVYGGIEQATHVTLIYDMELPYCNQMAVVPETVGQFTGLHDKNGKPIYEGDVVACVHWFFDGNEVEEHFDAVVGFKDGSFTLENIHSKFYQDYTGYKSGEGICWIGEINYCDDDYEVIGNIHDKAGDE